MSLVLVASLVQRRWAMVLTKTQKPLTKPAAMTINLRPPISDSNFSAFVRKFVRDLRVFEDRRVARVSVSENHFILKQLIR